MKQALAGLGKAAVVVLGLGYGVAQALDMFNSGQKPGDSAQNEARNQGKPESAPEDSTAAEAIDRRFSQIEDRLSRLEKSTEALMAQAAEPPVSNAAHAPVSNAPEPPATRASEHFITRAELSAAMEAFATTIDGDIERRFDIQNRSVQSLRTMVARTDELLEQVLETIESAGIPA